MPTSHKHIRAALLIVLLTVTAFLTSAGATVRASGRVPFQTSGDAPPQSRALPGHDDKNDAIRTLLQVVENEGKKKPEAWFQLGIEYDRAGDVKEARAAFQQAIKLRPGFVAAHTGLAYTFFVERNFAEAEKEAYRAATLDINSKDFTPYNVLTTIRAQRYREAAIAALAKAEQALAKNPDAADWNLLKAEALIGLSIPEQKIPPDLSFSQSNFPLPDESTRKAAREEERRREKEAADCFDKYLRLARPVSNEAFLRGQLEALRAYSQDAENGRAEDKIYSAADVSSKAVIRYKPEPGYTDEARNAGLVGTIRLRAVLASDGKVKHILVVMPLGHGLSEQAVKVARAIKFTPATVNGQPVSQLVILEYNFNIF